MCSGGELPEVEIISLLEEQIPRYRLRADALTQFQGEFFITFLLLILRILFNLKFIFLFKKKYESLISILRLMAN